MGVIVRKSIKSIIWSYLGIVIGFVNTVLLYPKFLTTEMVGLFSLFLMYAAIAGDIFSLGFNGAMVRLFPYFKNEKKKHNGVLFLGFLFITVGFLILLLLYFIFKNQLIAWNIEKSYLFAKYFYFLVPIILFSSIFILLESYSRMNHDPITPAFLIEFLQRVLILVVIFFYSLGFINQHLLIVLFSITISIKAVILIANLIRQKIFFLKPNFSYLTKKLRKELFSVSTYSIVTTLGILVIFTMDKMLVNHFLGLSATGVYSIAFYFGALVKMPARALNSVASTFISEAWKRDDKEKIKEIYYKSCINQFVIGGFFLLGIWANIDSILWVLGEDYSQAKWVVFLIGLGSLISMSNGVNEMTMLLSKYYRTYVLLLLISFAIGFLLIYSLTVRYGIFGTAFAVSATLLIYNFMNSGFLYLKFKFQPFSLKFLIIGIFYSGFYFITLLLPNIHPIIDLFLKGGIIVLFTLLMFIIYPVTNDISKIINTILSTLRIPIRAKIN